MDQQDKTKPEENQNKTAELSDKDLDQVAGGYTIELQNANVAIKSPRDSASGQPAGFNATQCPGNLVD